MKLFLDTMIWLHYEQIDDINWGGLLPDGASPTVVVPRITTKELDKHKNSHRSSSVKARARKWLSFFAELQKGGDAALKNGVTVELFLTQPVCDFVALGLDRTSSDDLLLGTILDYRTLQPHEAVRLFSADATPRLIATQLGIDAVEFPERFKLAEELDPAAKELRDLRADIDRAKHARPVLSGSFYPGAQSHLQLSLGQPLPFPENRVAAELKDFGARHPPSYAPEFPAGNRSLDSLFGPSREERERYNEEVRKYPAEFRAYARELHAIATMQQLGTEIDFRIENTGRSPADDVDVFLTFPRTCVVVEEYPESPDMPREPKPPASSLGIASLPRTILAPRILPSLVRPLGEEEEFFFVHEAESEYVVRKHFKRVKHGHVAALNQFYLSFPDFASAASFQVKCRITAANLLDPVEFTLNIQVSKAH